MSKPIDRLLEEFRRLPEEEKREFLTRIEEDGWYRTIVRHMQQEWDNPRDDAYNNL